jgi:hypothetical protein
MSLALLGQKWNRLDKDAECDLQEGLCAARGRG